MSSITRHASPLPLPFSKAVKAGGFIHLSGQLAVDAQLRVVDPDVGVQTRVILQRCAEALAEAGASMADVVKATVWLSDLKDFAAFNAEYQKHFTHGLPARSCVQAGLAAGAAVEIELLAYAGG